MWCNVAAINHIPQNTFSESFQVYIYEAKITFGNILVWHRYRTSMQKMRFVVKILSVRWNTLMYQFNYRFKR